MDKQGSGSNSALEVCVSNLMDANFAVETAALTKSQILQQAGIAMLAQANQLPQTVPQSASVGMS